MDYNIVLLSFMKSNALQEMCQSINGGKLFSCKFKSNVLLY